MGDSRPQIAGERGEAKGEAPALGEWGQVRGEDDNIFLGGGDQEEDSDHPTIRFSGTGEVASFRLHWSLMMASRRGLEVEAKEEEGGEVWLS